jgi:hypothetical protein
MEEVDFHPEDRAEEGEVLVAPLEGFDAHFQAKAAWSLERIVKEARAKGLPATLGAKDIREGGWSFYALRFKHGNRDIVLIRKNSPTRGLSAANKFMTKLVGNELRPVPEPLVAFDHTADLLVINKKVYVLRPQQAEQLFVDAEAVKKRAPQTVKKFEGGLKAKLSTPTSVAVERVCSKNAFVARRVERLIVGGNLESITAAKVRKALPNAGLGEDAFGKSGPLQADTDVQAKILIEIAADLYYQPRFTDASRRVGSYRTIS